MISLIWRDLMIKLQDEHTTITKTMIFILIAYIFAIGVRYIWVETMNDYPQFIHNGELIINTNDGFYFAEGARDIIAGFHQKNDISPTHTVLSQLTATLYHLLPVSFETLILYMSAFIASLIVIPLVLIGHALKQPTMGFIAALLASIAHSYYNRTMIGYYDTDMLNIVFPVLEVYSLILALTLQRNRYLIPITISIALYQWWYPQGYALDSALFAIIIAYALVFDRKNLFIYKIALFILIGVLNLPVFVKIAMAVAVFAIFHYKKDIATRAFIVIFAVVVAIYFMTGGFNPIWSHIKAYFFRSNIVGLENHLIFYNVTSTIREASQIPFSIFAERISGHTVTFVVAAIGYIALLFKYRVLIVTLPLVGLGFIAMSAGLRFTIYAVAPMALGIAFLIVLIANLSDKKPLRYLFISVLTIAVLMPNINHAKEYLTPTVLTHSEIEPLELLKQKSSRFDYIVAWWDYGYPIRYYADTKTLIDGGIHGGAQNYPVSYALTTPNQHSSAAMMRLYSEYYERYLEEGNQTLNRYNTLYENMVDAEGFSDADDFLDAISLDDYKLPASSHGVYLYLPYRMLDIFPTIALFSNLDLKSGKQKNSPYIMMSSRADDKGETIELGIDVFIDKRDNTLSIGSQKVDIKRVYHIGYDEQNALQSNEQIINSQGLSVMFLPNYSKVLIVDDFYLNSTFFQLFFFENYDKNLFEPVVLDPLTKIYKLKI